jgi:multisite-specific tRNA:(cytosine-C5)-methyltransferase
MLPKEERRALLLRLFNDHNPVVINTLQRDQPNDHDSNKPTTESAVDTASDVVMNCGDYREEDDDDIKEDIPPPLAAASAAQTEEDLLKQEDLAKGQEEEDMMAQRETYYRDGDEEDRFNTTV